jgi:hypothetical protein
VRCGTTTQCAKIRTETKTASGTHGEQQLQNHERVERIVFPLKHRIGSDNQQQIHEHEEHADDELQDRPRLEHRDQHESADSKAENQDDDLWNEITETLFGLTFR